MALVENLHTAIAYLKWLPKTFHLHGIHSPFIFKLEKETLRSPSEPDIKQKLIAYRKNLLSTKKVIEVKDYGAGSRVFNSSQREVNAIAKVAGATQKRLSLLQRLITHFQPTNTLELGTSLGLATAALAIDNTGRVITIEGCPNTAAIAKEELNRFGFENIELHVGDFNTVIKKLLPQKFEFIYFDGNHSQIAVLEYVNQLLPTITKDTVWIFDDIHWSREMTQAWKNIKAMPQISATIDCFWFGMVFFRPQQAKEDFYIRL